MNQIIDKRALLNKFNQKNACELLQMFTQSAQLDLEKMDELAAGNNFQELKFAAHSLKGACLTICSPTLSEHCQLLEEASLQKDGERCRYLVDSLKEDLSKALNEINEGFGQ